jgi:CheY-like chemotaxis protein
MHEPKQSGTRPRRALILVVDGERECRELIADVLEDDGYGVVRVEGGAEAIRLLEAGARPAAMTLDLDMPVVDGHAVLRHVRCSSGLVNLPVVVISSSVRHGQHVPCATAVLSKPVAVSALLETLRACTPPSDGEVSTGAG